MSWVSFSDLLVMFTNSLGLSVSRLEAIASTLEAIALRLEAIAIRLEAIALRLEATLFGHRKLCKGFFCRNLLRGTSASIHLGAFSGCFFPILYSCIGMYAMRYICSLHVWFSTRHLGLT